MAFNNDSPDKLETVFFQRGNTGKDFYEEVHISGSNLIFYLSSSGELTADKISVFASKYGLTGGGSGSGTSLSTGSTYPFTASWALNTVGGSGASLGTGSTYPITASRAISSSFAQSALSSSYALNSIQGTTLGTGSTYPFTSSQAISASWAPSTGGSTLLSTGSTYPITSSWNISASYARTSSGLNELSQDVLPLLTNVYNLGSPTQQWKSLYVSSASIYVDNVPISVDENGVFIITTESSSYSQNSSVAFLASDISGGIGALLNDGSSYFITSSYSESSNSSSYSLTASFATNGGITLGTGSTYPFTSSRSISSSFAITSSKLNGFNYENTSSISNVTQSNYVVLQRLTSSLLSAFFKYVINSGSNLRVGEVIGGWNSGNLTQVEYTTTDIGDTSQVTMSMNLSASYIQLVSNISTTTNWEIRASGDYL